MTRGTGPGLGPWMILLALALLTAPGVRSQDARLPRGSELPPPPPVGGPRPGTAQPIEGAEKRFSRPFPPTDVKDRDAGRFWAKPTYLQQFSHLNPAVRLSRPRKKDRPAPFDTLKILHELRRMREERAAKAPGAADSESTYNPRVPIQPTPYHAFPDFEPLAY